MAATLADPRAVSIYQICEDIKSGSPRADAPRRTPSQTDRRYELPGTGRIAFGAIAEDRPLFKLAKIDVTVAPKTLESDFAHMDIDVVPAQAAPHSTGKTAAPAGARLSAASSSSSVGPAALTAQRQSNKRPFAPAPAPAPGKPATKSSTVPLTGNPYLVNKSKPTGASTTAVAGQTGKLAAMARLAALGEDWPEEEELPGMTMPVSSSLGANSGAVMRDAQLSMQRQQKVVTAKRKK